MTDRNRRNHTPEASTHIAALSPVQKVSSNFSYAFRFPTHGVDTSASSVSSCSGIKAASVSVTRRSRSGVRPRDPFAMTGQWAGTSTPVRAFKKPDRVTGPSQAIVPRGRKIRARLRRIRQRHAAQRSTWSRFIGNGAAANAKMPSRVRSTRTHAAPNAAQPHLTRYRMPRFTRETIECTSFDHVKFFTLRMRIRAFVIRE